jgi:hypothetical protein
MNIFEIPINGSPFVFARWTTCNVLSSTSMATSNIYFHFIVTISILPFKSIVSKFVSCYSHFVFMNARTFKIQAIGMMGFFALILIFDFVFKMTLSFPLLCHNEVETWPLSSLKFTTFAYTTFQHAIFNSMFLINILILFWSCSCLYACKLWFMDSKLAWRWYNMVW